MPQHFGGFAPPPAPSAVSYGVSPSVPVTMHTSDAHQQYLQRSCEHDHFIPLRHGAQEHGHVRTHRHEKGVPALFARCRHADPPVVICHRLHAAGRVRAMVPQRGVGCGAQQHREDAQPSASPTCGAEATRRTTCKQVPAKSSRHTCCGRGSRRGRG